MPFIWLHKFGTGFFITNKAEPPGAWTRQGAESIYDHDHKLGALLDKHVPLRILVPRTADPETGWMPWVCNVVFPKLAKKARQ